ncbi:MAG: hypothetical protein ACP5XB_01690 [Isosphaeraceae bacterium]
MSPGWLETVAQGFLVVSVVCALIIMGDIMGGRRQKMAIMNLVWPITALYSGPLGLWVYWVLGRPAAQQAHSSGHGAEGHEHEGDKTRKPFRQTVLVATSHRGAGCATAARAAQWAT